METGAALGTALLQVSGTDLMVVGLLAFACFGLPGIAALLYFRRRRSR
jgi:hypothetical protein